MAVIFKNNFVNPLVCLLLFFFAIFISGCKLNSEKQVTIVQKSDPKAIEIADAVLRASGGRENWQNTRYVAWKYYGRRLEVWDKQTGDVRIDSEGSVILMNLITKKGRAWKYDYEMTEPDDLQRALDYGYEAWATDSYWIFLPFKLHDEGVILKYLGEGEIEEGRKTDIISLTFANVGLTPKNKYHVHVDKESKLIVSLTYFKNASDDRPTYSAPWKDYKQYGNILLSADRGEKKHTDIGVFNKLPESVFKNPKSFTWAEIDSLNKLKS